MITLIAESKTMVQPDINAATDCANLPSGEETAAEVMGNILSMSVNEIVAEMKVSAAMAAKIMKMAYDFPAKETSSNAIEAFTGVVFKALDYDTLDDKAKNYVDKNVRIISTLYGWLLPYDRIKPYRLDYTTRLAPGDIAFSSFWRKDVTQRLVKTIREREIRDVINLLPGDAEKCIDKKLVKNFAKIWKVEFKEIIEGNSLRTPAAGRLKELRGKLLREMAQRDIKRPEELMTLATPLFLPLGTPDYPDHIVFAV